MAQPETRTEWGILAPGMTTPLSMPHWTQAEATHYSEPGSTVVTRTVTEWHTP